MSIHLPPVTTDQMKQVERLMIEEYGVSAIIMMENAARNTAWLARKLCGGNIKGKKITILSHKGNNGADGLAAARHLTNFGANVTCYLTCEKKELTAQGVIQYKILEAINTKLNHISQTIPASFGQELEDSDMIIDSLLGFNISGKPKEPVASVITQANHSKSPILSVDIPSGLSGDTGQASDPTVKAQATITLGLPKAGLYQQRALPYTGKIFLADITIPKQVYQKIGIEVPTIFQKSEVIPLTTQPTEAAINPTSNL